jgi:Na+/H+ antiporter NhaD/arsenite permease-like protein
LLALENETNNVNSVICAIPEIIGSAEYCVYLWLVGIVAFIFVAGYVLITLEHVIGLNKAATALVTGVLCWVACLLVIPDPELLCENLMRHLGETAGILFFLLGAMTIVELIDAHDGFYVFTKAIRPSNKRILLWTISCITFFLSAVLDNLTTTILMVSIVRKLISNREERWYYLGLVIIAANAGGVWSPIGDVTTSMLWIGGQLTTSRIIFGLILPSFISMIVPLTLATIHLKGSPLNIYDIPKFETTISAAKRNTILFSGITVLLGIPIFKTTTHLPPFMGMLLGLGILWVISEIIHKDRDTSDKDVLSVAYALRKIDSPSILFFLGILLAIGALQSSGLLEVLAGKADAQLGNTDLIAIVIGLFSAVVDNVPLVAASMGMYDLIHFPTDHRFWEFLAYTSGTGGSALIIGSAAGVAVMGMEKIDFFWYLRKISWLALAGFISGSAVFLCTH